MNGSDDLMPHEADRGDAAAGERRAKWGLRGTLFMSFGAIVALTALAIGVAVFALREVRFGYEELATRDIPSIVGSANLAISGTDMTVYASQLVNATEEGAREAASRRLRAAVDVLARVVAEIGDSGAAREVVAELQAKTSSFASMLDGLEEFTKANIAASLRIRARLDELFVLYDEITGTLAPRVDDAYFELVIGGETAGSETAAIVDTIVVDEMQALQLMFELRGTVHAMIGATSSYLLVDSVAISKLFEDKLVASSQRLATLLADLDEAGITLGVAGELFLLSELGGEARAMRGADTFDVASSATSQMLSQLIETQQLIDNALITAIDDRLFDLTMNAEDAVGKNAAVINDLLNNQVSALKTTLEAVSAVHQFVAILVQGALTEDASLIVPLQDKVVASANGLRAAVDDIADEELRAKVDALLAFGADRTGMLAERRGALDALASATAIVSDVFATARDIGETTRRLISQRNDVIEVHSGNIDAMFAMGTLVLVVIGLVSAVIAAVIGFLVVDRGIAKPLARLVAATKAIAAGDLEADIAVEARGGEIGDMVQALQVFRHGALERDRLQNAGAAEQMQRQQRQQQVEALIAEFRTNVQSLLEQVSANADQMQSTAEILATVAGETSSEANLATTVSSEASSSVQTVASAAEEMAASIAEISNQVEASTKVVAQASANADATNVEIEALAEAARRIGAVIGLISDIAAQTNLLALNATIEAARAGDAGRGFAVVASEVKALASQTASATEEIASQIAGIQGSTSQAVQSIALITRTMDEVNRYTSAIAGAIGQQNAATSEITASAQQAAHGTSSLATTMNRVREVVDENNQSMQQMLTSAADVNSQAEELRRTIDHFLARVAAA
jgi:methyl-accepting chemotaxis protein